MPLPVSTAFVFSHPNHELAVHGLILEVDPWMVYLTDGGGADRIAQSREGLSRLGRLEKAVFLNHPEDDFYQALLRKDARYFQGVAEEVRAALAEREVTDVAADALEFYNPVHDLAGVIAKAALSGRSGLRCHDIPLVYEKPGTVEDCVVQRLPGPWESVTHSLTTDQLEQKRTARAEVYTLLADQFGTALSDLSDAHLGQEVLGAAPESGLREPGSDYSLRYERRAALLLKQGKIDEAITHQGHFLPIAQALLSGVRG